MRVGVIGDAQHTRAPWRHRRLLALVAVVLVALAGTFGVRWYAHRQPIGESKAIKVDEQLVADWAQAHGAGAEVGRPAGCEARVIGEYNSDAMRKADLELLCSHLSLGGKCAGSQGTAFVSEAVATFNSAHDVVAVSVDNENDAGEYQWVERNFAPRWRHVEAEGPRYGNLLQTRLDAKYVCP